MKNYNYEARYEDKYGSPEPSEPEKLKIIAAHEQLSNLDHHITKLDEMLGILSDRLRWVTKPSKNVVDENKKVLEENSSELTHKLSIFVEKIKDLQGGVGHLLESLEV